VAAGVEAVAAVGAAGAVCAWSCGAIAMAHSRNSEHLFIVIPVITI